MNDEHPQLLAKFPNQRLRVAVIGAGISGLMCARTLHDHGIAVKVFEKSRGAGGRMATRRASDQLTFDHGAQYFTVRDASFETHVKSWVQDGITACWHARIGTLTAGRLHWSDRITPRFIGVPGMSAVCRHVAKELEIRFDCRVVPPERERGVWRLRDVSSAELGLFDYVVTSAPAPQSAELLSGAPALQATARSVRVNGCWAVLLSFDKPLGLPFDAAFVNESALSWIACNSSKPERCGYESWVLHASSDWTNTCLEDEPDHVVPRLLEAFWTVIGAAPRTPIYAAGHRWRWAQPQEPLPTRCLFDSSLRLGACGDWCGGPRVEGAFLSGIAVADRVLADFESVG